MLIFKEQLFRAESLSIIKIAFIFTLDRTLAQK